MTMSSEAWCKTFKFSTALLEEKERRRKETITENRNKFVYRRYYGESLADDKQFMQKRRKISSNYITSQWRYDWMPKEKKREEKKLSTL